MSSTPNCVAIIQTRQGSHRLPGKALKPLYKQMGALELLLTRLKPSKQLSQVVVATTPNKEDDAIEALCEKLGTACFRGSEEDVLDRYYQAAIKYKADDVVRLTGDCPLQDYQVVDYLINAFYKSDVDYAANAIQPTYPDGFDAEILSFSTLEKLQKLAVRPSDREHVTPYLHRHPEDFKLINIAYSKQVAHIRLTLDTQEDFDLLHHLAEKLLPNAYTHLEDILTYLEEHPELLEINQQYERNEGYKKSLENEKD